MNKYDFYFKQIVSQGEMDQAFAWVQDADHAMMLDLMADYDSFGGPFFGGISDGGLTAEQAVPDLTIAVSAIAAWGKSGERIHNVTPTVNVDCSVDEYGTSTIVATPGESRIISIFARAKIDLQDPTVDGNGLTVYTKKIEDMEFFVRMGTAAGSPVAPPLLSDALLLVDLERANAQTTLQNSDMTFTRREDWVRFVGANISFDAGTPKGGLKRLFNYVDTLWAGGSPFTFGKTWFNSVIVGIVGGAPSTVAEALDAIAEDLADDSGTGGSILIGSPAIAGTPGGYGDLSAASVSAMLGSISTLIAAHINGSNKHPAADITTAAYGNLRLFHVSETLNMPTSGQITNSAGGEADVLINYGEQADWLLVQVTTDTGWSYGVKIDDGTSYSDPPDAYYLGVIYLDNWMAGGSLQSTLENLTLGLAERIDRNEEVTLSKRWRFHGGIRSERELVAHNFAGGGGHPRGALYQLQQGGYASDGDPAWPAGDRNDISVGGITEICDIAPGWDFLHETHGVFVVGKESKVGLVYFNPVSSNFMGEMSADMTTDAAGTLLSSVNPDAEPWAICTNGELIFVLVGDGVSPSPALVHSSIYAYDARHFDDNDELIWKWTANLGVKSALTARKDDSNIIANDWYVFAALGGEDAQTGGSGEPLARCDAGDGTNVIKGRGAGAVAAAAPFPSGGLGMTRDSISQGIIFYTTFNSTTGKAEVVSADYDLTAHASLTRQLISTATTVKDLVVTGRYCIIPNTRNTISSPQLRLHAWDIYRDEFDYASFLIPHCHSDYYLGRISFDGTRIFARFVEDLAAGTGENHVIAPLHVGEFQRNGNSNTPADRPRHFCNPLQSGDYAVDADLGDRMGRIVSWGPGVWYMLLEEADSRVYFMPIAGM